MAGGQFGEIETFKMKSDDPSDFLECLNWDQAITQSVGYESDVIISHYSTQFAHNKTWLQRRIHSTLEDLALSERQANLFLDLHLRLQNYENKIYGFWILAGEMVTWPIGLEIFSQSIHLSG